MYGTGFEVSSSAGSVATVEPQEFLRLLDEATEPMVVYQKPHWCQPYHRYVFTFRGMTLYTRSRESLSISKNVTFINATSIYLPGTY